MDRSGVLCERFLSLPSLRVVERRVRLGKNNVECQKKRKSLEGVVDTGHQRSVVSDLGGLFSLFVFLSLSYVLFTFLI